jgi:hypothetical protein
LPSEDCSECARLWQEFAAATNAQLRILSQRQIAVIERGSAVLDALDRAFADSAIRRQIARDAFKAHAATHNQKK